MTRKMKKVNKDFLEIEILKERYKLRIMEQELKIKSGFNELTDNLTGVALLNKFKENLFSGSGFAFKLGFMVVTLLRDRLSRKKKK
jgi:hypothetical protein